MSPSLRNDVPPQCGQAAPGGSSSSTGRVNQASAPWARNRSRKWRTVSAVSSWVRQVVQPRAGIGTPQDRCRLMHQSGRSDTMASIRVWPQSGSQSDLVDRLERPAAQVVVIDGDEPLLGRPEDHRLLAPPAMRITVRRAAARGTGAPTPSSRATITGLAAKTCWPVSHSGASAVNRPDSSTGLRTES